MGESEEKKSTKLPKWAWILIIVVVLSAIGNIIGGDDEYEGSSDTVSSGSTIEYEWVSIQIIEFDSADTTFDLIFEEIYDTVTLPQDANKWGLRIDWAGGDKDSYVSLTMWEYGEVDDTKRGTIYENAKQGSETWEKSCDGGETVYVEASAIHGCHGVITVFAYKPQ